MDQETQRTILRAEWGRMVEILAAAQREIQEWRQVMGWDPGVTSGDYVGATNGDYVVIMHPLAWRQLQWELERPGLRRLYREQGYPFGRNQGAFKRWAMIGRLHDR